MHHSLRYVSRISALSLRQNLLYSRATLLQKFTMPPKRKRSSVAIPAVENGVKETPIPVLNATSIKPPPAKRRPARRVEVDTNPDRNGDIMDGQAALRASPDADEKGEAMAIDKVNTAKLPPPILPPAKTNGVKAEDSDSPLSDIDQTPNPSPAKTIKKPTKSSIAAKKGSDEIKAFVAEQAAKKAATTKVKKEDEEDEWDKRVDPDGEDEMMGEDVDIMKKEAGRPPPVNSDYLPLPWKGRLGYACLNTYLRFSNPPVFTSRTCRMASIVEHRHPLKDPSLPEHATKNRPDKTKPASIERGQKYVEDICLANVRDIPKMLRWNDKYGIKFMRLSSEMFPFASHAEFGYKLAPFASEALAEAGRVATELGHRLSTHPGQFTQLGSPRPEVIKNAFRDLEYHDEMLSLLKQPEQQDRDTVMILHMGGTFGDKAATLDRFRENYRQLSPSIKMRLVLENDDVSWSVHDLLPICEELSIPLCLDFHHHNIIFDSSQIREGTLDIISLYPRIKALWDKKKIRQKMHYSEPCPEAITGRQRRKHNPRPITMPPCPDDMDLMIEAKDKEQAVFEMMRTLRLPGWDTFNNIIPYERADDNKPLPKKAKKKKTKKQVANEVEEFGKELSEEEDEVKPIVPDEEVGMGGLESRVYWPTGMEEWLRPKKREIKKKSGEGDEEEMFRNPTPANFQARKAIEAKNKEPLDDEMREKLKEATCVTDLKRILEEVRAARAVEGEDEDGEDATPNGKKKKVTPKKKAAAATPKTTLAKKKVVKRESVPEKGGYEDEDESMSDGLSLPSGEEDEMSGVPNGKPAASKRQSGRAKGKKQSYVDAEGVSDLE